MASDIELLQAWRDSRDAEAFKELVRRYAGLVHAAAKRILANEATAEDVTQESFERLAMTEHPPEGPVAPWLHRVATNRALDRIRADQTRRAREQRYMDEAARKAGAIVWSDVYVHVDEAINALPERLRVPMIEHFYRDRSAADIAAELGLTRQAVSYRIGKGVQGVRHALRKRGISAASAGLLALMSANLAEAAPLPVSLTTNLGRLAVAGVVGSSLNTATTAATALGGVLVMKKALVVGALAIVVLLSVWVTPKLYTPKAEPPLPAYVPRTESPQSPLAAAEDSEESVEQKERVVESSTTTGDIAGRFYDVITGEGIPEMRPEVFPAENGTITGGVLRLNGLDSDASGAYRLAGLEPGQYGVRAPQSDAYPQGPSGGAPRFITVAANSVVRNVDIGLEPGARVSGVVLSSDGEPVEGASVIGRPIGTVYKGFAESGPDGTFHLMVRVYDGSVELQAGKDGLYSPIKDSLTLSYEGIKDVVLRLTEPRSASISGNVVDAGSRPVADALVTLHSRVLPLKIEKLPYSVETSRRGTFRFDRLLPGDYSVYLAPAGGVAGIWAEQEVAVLSLRAGETLDGLHFSLGANLSISGRVVDPSGEGIERAVLDASLLDSSRRLSEGYAFSGADGRFIIAGLESGEYEVSACLKGELHAQEVGAFPAGTGDLEVVLAGRGSVEGRVVRADTGEALTQFRVYIQEGNVQRLDYYHFHECYGGALTYDPEGRFVRECSRNVAGDGFATVIAVAPGFAPSFQNVRIPENGMAMGVEVRLEPSRRIDGRVVDSHGRPVAGARISWGDVTDGGDMSRVVARTDPSGHFSVKSILADEQNLWAFHPSYPPSAVRVASKVTIVLEAGGVLQGRVRGKDGTRHNVRCVAVECPDLPGGGSFRDFPGPDGHYRIAGIPAGPAHVILALDPRGIMKRQTHIVSGQTTNEDFEVVPTGGTVHGQILGEGVDPEQVYLTLTVSNSEGVRTYRANGAPDGVYQITGVMPGSAQLTAKDVTGGMRRVQTCEFEIVDDGPVVQDVEFGPVCTVAGAFLGAAQERIGVVVALRGAVDLSGLVTVEAVRAYLPEAEAITIGQTECDALGQYVLSGLPIGTYTLVAITVDAEDDQNIALWRWTSAAITFEEEGETMTVDFDFH